MAPDETNSNPIQPEQPEPSKKPKKKRTKKAPAENGIRLVKLVSGELLLADCRKTTKGFYLLVHPFVVIPLPIQSENEDEGETIEYDITYRTWIFGSNQATYEIPAERIVLFAEPEARTIKDYLFMTELSKRSKNENIEENMSDEIIDKIKNMKSVEYKDIELEETQTQEFSSSIDEEFDKQDTSPWSHTRRFNILEDLD